MGMFLNAMLDPFAAGRSGGVARHGDARRSLRHRGCEAAAREAFAADMPVKAPACVPVLQRWSGVGRRLWRALRRRRRSGGGGSNDVRATVAGFAAGLDYRVSRDTVVGVAAAVGENRWNLSAGLGKGGADVGQIGGYASTRWQNLYFPAPVAVAWHRAWTNRVVRVAGADQLEAGFDATSFGGRAEGGYRFGSVQYRRSTPYAAVQVQSLHTPAYSEFATVGSNQFALTLRVADRDRHPQRARPLGRHALPVRDGNTVVLRGRAAWVHDFNPGSRINPAFQTLPGASFAIDGAAAPRDAALTSAVGRDRGCTSGLRG